MWRNSVEHWPENVEPSEVEDPVMSDAVNRLHERHPWAVDIVPTGTSS